MTTATTERISYQLEESPAQQFARLPKEIRDRLIEQMPKEKLVALPYDWKWWARPKQLPPKGNWFVWCVLAGRGFGKTRTGAEWVRAMAEQHPGCVIALVGPTSQAVNRFMVGGDSGLLKVCPPWFAAKYESSKAQVTFPNGSVALLYSADEPDRIRGANHHFAWCDELAMWRYPEAWDMLQFTLRIGKNPRTIITTTPKPVQFLRDILDTEELKSGSVVLTSGITYENEANLHPKFIEQIRKRYENTNLGKQEIYAVLLSDISGIFWKKDWFKPAAAYDEDGNRIRREYQRVVVAIDPATTSKKGSNDTAITVCAKGEDGNYYVLHAEGYRLSPQGWAEEAIRLYKKFDATKIIAEINNGGEMVESTIRQVTSYTDAQGKKQKVNGKDLPIKVIHATKGKKLRAEPISSLYEQGKVYHVGNLFALEEQMVKFDGQEGGEDDLVDSTVYGLAELSENDIRDFALPKIGGRRRVSSLQLI